MAEILASKQNNVIKLWYAILQLDSPGPNGAGDVQVLLLPVMWFWQDVVAFVLLGCL